MVAVNSHTKPSLCREPQIFRPAINQFRSGLQAWWLTGIYRFYDHQQKKDTSSIDRGSAVLK
jgi:hypothetical protein